MPAARGGRKRAPSKASSSASTEPKNKKKRGVFQLEITSPCKRKGRVYSCGQGDVGQLGLGEDVLETTKFKHVTSLKDNIVEVYAGGMHTVALDSDGKVWTFGCNDEGALGRATADDAAAAAPAPLALPRAAAAAAGDSHTAVLLATGQVFVCGTFRDSHGSMGLLAAHKAAALPVPLALPEPAAAVASGQDHLVVLTTSGAVYTLGCGEQGQLGRLAQRSATRDSRHGLSTLLTPQKVSLKFPVSRIFAGFHATFAVDANTDHMYAWGLNNYNQLGISGENRRCAIFSPTECDSMTLPAPAPAPADAAPAPDAPPSRWGAVAAGQHHTVVLDSSGKVYCIGRCEYGRLGLGPSSGDALVLTPVSALSSVRCVCIAAGTCNSFAITDTGTIYGWGMGSEGQLGDGASEDRDLPAIATATAAGTAPAAVAAGGQHTVVRAVLTNNEATPSPTPPVEESPAPLELNKEETTTKSTTKTNKQANKRRNEQEAEVSSTSSAATQTKKPKLNGDDNKDTKMEVEETDKAEPAAEKPAEVPTPQPEPEPMETKQDDSDKTSQDDDTKTETTDTSSQDSVARQQKTAVEEKPDVEMKEAAVNGTPETIESKKPEDIVQSASEVTTVA